MTVLNTSLACRLKEFFQIALQCVQRLHQNCALVDPFVMQGHFPSLLKGKQDSYTWVTGNLLLCKQNIGINTFTLS